VHVLVPASLCHRPEIALLRESVKRLSRPCGSSISALTAALECSGVLSNATRSPPARRIDLAGAINGDLVLTIQAGSTRLDEIGVLVAPHHGRIDTG
jgi:hypothetical protein